MVIYVPGMAGAQPQIGQDQMEEMLSIGEAADFIGVSVDTLRRWSKKKRVTTYRSPGGHRYYKKKDLVDLFDARYTRDEPTERSSKEIDDEKENTEIASSDIQQEVSLHSLPIAEDMTIPKMQPVQVLTGEKNYQALAVPDQTPPPPPMPMTQVQTHMQVETVTIDQTRTSTSQNFRQPAGPIHRQAKTEEQVKEHSSDTVISDFTSGGGFQTERTQFHTSTPVASQSDENELQQREKTHVTETDMMESQIKDVVDAPLSDHVTLQPPWRMPSPALDEDKNEQDEITEESTESPVERSATQDTVHPKEKVSVNSEQKDEKDRITIDERPVQKTVEVDEEIVESKVEIDSQPKEEITETQTITQEEETSTEIKQRVEDQDKESQKQDEVIRSEVKEKKSRGPVETPQPHQSVKLEPSTAVEERKVTETNLPEKKVEQRSTLENKKAEDEPVGKKPVIPPQEQKRSILEPAGIDVAKLNKLEKMNDESWFAKNKSNILIGFTVFLLIDIILFVIWLTTSRILSPIP